LGGLSISGIVLGMIQNFLNKLASRFRLWKYPFFPLWLSVYRAGTVFKSDNFQLRNIYHVLPQSNKLDSRRYIISSDLGDIYGGLGCSLSLLAPCWNYARQTNRTLVIDWRGNPYTRHDPEINLFPLLFEEPDQDDIGVPCIADDTISGFQFPQPILGPAEPLIQSWRTDRLPSGGLSEASYRHIMYFCREVNFPTLLPGLGALFGIKRNQKGLDFKQLKNFYGNLKLKTQWREVVDKLYEENMSDVPIIGIHIRHGNGEEKFNSHFSGRQIEDFENYVDKISQKILKHGGVYYQNKFKVFLCTDSDIAVATFKRKFPTLITQEAWRPPPNAGINSEHADQHPKGPEHVAAEALIDIYLLAKCDSVLVPRNTEFTSIVPYIMEKPNSMFLYHQEVAKI
jgi:hypothetical protein